MACSVHLNYFPSHLVLYTETSSLAFKTVDILLTLSNIVSVPSFMIQFS